MRKSSGRVAISPDGRWLVTGSEDKTARLWDLAAKDPAGSSVVLQGHEAGVIVIAISEDSRRLVTWKSCTRRRASGISVPRIHILTSRIART